MRSVSRGKTWEGRCGFGRGSKNQRQEGIRSWQTAVGINHTSVLTKADLFHTYEYIHIHLANSNIVKTSDLFRKEDLGEVKSEVGVKWELWRNRISFNFVRYFLSGRGSQWHPGGNLLIGIPREIPTSVPWESRRELAKIPTYTSEGNDIRELVFLSFNKPFHSFIRRR